MTGLKLLALGSVLVAGASVATVASRAESPDGLVYDAMAAPATVSYTGVVQLVRIGNSGSEACVYRIEHRAPNQTLRVYTSPSSMSGEEVLSKGNESFTIDAKHRRIVETRNDAINDQIAIDNNYLLLRQNYRAIQRGEETMDGRHTVEVTLVNNYTHRASLLVRIDAQTKLVLDKQQFAGDGALLSETRFEEVTFTSTIPAADFALPQRYALTQGTSFGSPSDDPSSMAGSAGFDVHEPKFLPDGFSPVEGNMVSLQGVRTLHVLYSDGLRTVSLFENEGTMAPDMAGLHPAATAISGRDAQYAEEGPTTLLAWHDGGLEYTLVGELQLDELKRIASSIGP